MVLVGPDGVGKTTVADALTRAFQGPTLYFHFLPVRGESLRPEPGAPAPRKEIARGVVTPVGVVAGWLRLLRNLLRFWYAYLSVVRPAVSSGTLVIGDRWGYGYAVQPEPLRFFGPVWLGRVGTAALPRPDLIANLVAPVQVVAARKAELPPSLIAAELEAWRSIPAAPLVDFDALAAPSDVATAILAELAVQADRRA